MRDREEKGGEERGNPGGKKRETGSKALGSQTFMVPKTFSKILTAQVLLKGSAFQHSLIAHV